MWTGFWEWHRTLIPKLPKKILHFFFYPTSLCLIERMKKWRRCKIYRGQKRFFLFFFSHLCLAKRIEKWNDGKRIKFSFVGCKERNSNLHKVQYIYIYNILNFFTLFHQILKAEKWRFAWKILHHTIFLPIFTSTKRRKRHVAIQKQSNLVHRKQGKQR